MEPEVHGLLPGRSARLELCCGLVRLDFFLFLCFPGFRAALCRSCMFNLSGLGAVGCGRTGALDGEVGALCKELGIVVALRCKAGLLL